MTLSSLKAELAFKVREPINLIVLIPLTILSVDRETILEHSDGSLTHWQPLPTEPEVEK